MDGFTEWIFPSTLIADVVKFRPASLDTFYRLQCNPWAEGGKSLHDFCGRDGERTQALVRELAALPVPGQGSDWEALPAHHLIDYLTAEHRQLLLSELPAFRTLLEMPLRDAPGERLFGIMLEAFHRLTDTLRSHLNEEEEEIFPAILKNDYALRHGEPGDAAQPVADRVLAASRLLNGEVELVEALDRWTHDSEEAGCIQGGPKASEMAARSIKRLERKIRAHGELERDRLYPIASRIENELSAALSR